MNRVERDRVGATRGKIVVVGALAVVLAAVLASNFRGSAQEPVAPPERADAAPAPAPSPAAMATVRARSTTALASPFGEFAEDVAVPEYSLEKLVTFDPLAAPAWMAATEQPVGAAEDTDAHSIEQLQAAQNAIILVAGDHRVARIGSQDYRVGDMVGRYRITDISSAGIVLSEPAEDAADAK